jgi:hypothetical protein
MKPRRLFCWLTVASLLFVLGLVAGNVVDYVRFHHAIARARGLTEAQLRAIGDRGRAVSKPGRIDGSEAPAEFRPLKPHRGSLYPVSGEEHFYFAAAIPRPVAAQ